MSKFPETADPTALSYEAYIDEKFKTGAIGGVYTLESSTQEIPGDLEGGMELQTIRVQRPTGFKVPHLSVLTIANKKVVSNGICHPGRTFPLLVGQHHRGRRATHHRGTIPIC